MRPFGLNSEQGIRLNWWGLSTSQFVEKGEKFCSHLRQQDLGELLKCTPKPLWLLAFV
jgi:hypothetical protein